MDESSAVESLEPAWTPAAGDVPHASFTFDSRQRVYERKSAGRRSAPRNRVLPLLLVAILVFAGLTAAWTYRDELAQSASMLLMRNAQGEGGAGNHATVSESQNAPVARS